MKGKAVNTRSSSEAFQKLRERAEQILGKRGRKTAPSEKDEFVRLVHELEVHQVELELQNEELRRAQSEVRASRDEFYDLYDSAPIAYVTISQKGKVERINQAARRMLKGSGEFVLGSPFGPWIYPEDLSLYFSFMERLARGKSAGPVELRIQGKKGEPVWVQLEGTTRTEENGSKHHRLILVDANERKRAEEKLQQSEERLRVALEGGELGLWDRDFVKDKILWNEKLYELLGRDPQGPPITGDAFFEYIHPQDRERVLKRVDKWLDEGDIFHDEFRVVREDGETIWLASSGRVYRDETGRAVRMAGINYDISKRKRMEEELLEAKHRLEDRVQEQTAELSRYVADLAESEGRFRLIAETVQDVFWMMDFDSREYVYISPAYEHIWGRNRGRPTQDLSSFLETIHPEDREKVRSVREGFSQPIQDLEFRILRPGGSIRWVRELSYVAGERESRRLVGVVRDITERKKQQEQLRRLSSRLLEAQESERRNVALEIHDSIGGNLLAIKMAVDRKIRQMLSGVPSSESIFLEEIQDMIKSCVNDVRGLQQNLRPSLLDDLGLDPAVNALCRGFEKLHKDIRTAWTSEMDEVQIPENLKIVMYRIVQEALNNVAKHSGAKHVSIFLKQEDGEIQLMIRDDGHGFDPRNTFAGRAKGLGLESMRERCKFSGGSFSIHSGEGEGTTIRCMWPCD